MDQATREAMWSKFTQVLSEAVKSTDPGLRVSVSISDNKSFLFEACRAKLPKREVALNFAAPYDHCFVHIEEGQPKRVEQFSFQQNGHIKWQGEITEMSQEDAAKKIMKFLTN